jgi:hypothetical protein
MENFSDLKTVVKSKRQANALIIIMFIEMLSVRDAVTKILMRVYRSAQPYVPLSKQRPTSLSVASPSKS